VNPTTACTSTQITKLLHAKHHAPEWASFAELRNAAGFSANRSFDFWTINTWPSKGLKTIGYEIKVSRSDFARELENPRKRKALEEVCHECYFAAPKGLIDPRELPEGWGLIEATNVLRIAVRAPQKSEPKLDWDLLAVILRRARAQVEDCESQMAKAIDIKAKHENPEAYIAEEIAKRLESEKDRFQRKLKQEIAEEQFGSKLDELRTVLREESLYTGPDDLVESVLTLVRRARRSQSSSHARFFETSAVEIKAKLDKIIHLAGGDPSVKGEHAPHDSRSASGSS
jgi:hypothetical protein